MGRPRPLPPVRRLRDLSARQNRSKIRGRSSGLMPMDARLEPDTRRLGLGPLRAHHLPQQLVEPGRRPVQPELPGVGSGQVPQVVDDVLQQQRLLEQRGGEGLARVGESVGAVSSRLAR
jgi:hypothetical protein